MYVCMYVLHFIQERGCEEFESFASPDGLAGNLQYDSICNIHIHTYIHTHIYTYIHTYGQLCALVYVPFFLSEMLQLRLG